MLFVGNKTPLYDNGLKLSNLTTTKIYKMSIKSLTIEQRKGLKKHLVHGDLKRVAKNSIYPIQQYMVFSMESQIIRKF